MADAALLNLVLYLPVPASRCCIALPARDGRRVRWLSLGVMIAAVRADRAACTRGSTRPIAGLQFETRLPWIADWGVYYQIGLDGYNVLLVLLTAFLGPLVVAGAFTAIQQGREALLRDGVRCSSSRCSAPSSRRTCSCSTCSGRRC